VHLFSASQTRRSNIPFITMGGSARICLQNLDARVEFNATPFGRLVVLSAMFFDENARTGDWREQVLHCRDQSISINREVAVVVAIADLLKLPDDLPLMPAVTAAMSVPICLSDPASLAH
jgi:hypothetical protein